jgi:hypothetical protein
MNENIHNLYCSLNMISTIKTGSVRWAALVEQMEKMRNAYTVAKILEEIWPPERRV